MYSYDTSANGGTVLYSYLYEKGSVMKTSARVVIVTCTHAREENSFSLVEGRAGRVLVRVLVDVRVVRVQ